MLGAMRIALVTLALAAGCSDLSGFTGSWQGTPVTDPALLDGIMPDAAAVLQVDAVDRVSLRGSLTVGGDQAALRPVARAANDTLGSIDLPDSPLRSYWMVAPLAAGDAIAIVSLYGDEHVDLRLLRSDSLYAVFHLRR
jgi:hypothetical protein